MDRSNHATRLLSHVRLRNTLTYLFTYVSAQDHGQLALVDNRAVELAVIIRWRWSIGTVAVVVFVALLS